MKKIKAFTLIETLLVIVVIALILLVAANQFQRYQQARIIQQAKTAVQLISTYGSQLYLSNCANMVKYSTDLVCPATAATNAGISQTNWKTSPCSTLFSVVNPFLLASSSSVVNYTIYISQKPGVPLITIGLPISTSFFHGKSANQILNSPIFQKYIAALQPSVVMLKGQSNGYYPGVGLKPITSSDDVCINGSKQDVCMVWRITPANWGNTATTTVNNQNLNNQLAAFAGQYAPTSAEWQKIQSEQTEAVINCPGLNAQAIFNGNNP